MLSRLRYMGWASTVSGWLVILLSVSLNPWFVFTEHAFSDLGVASANTPWVFNIGMILTGFMIVLFGVYLHEAVINNMSRLGSIAMMATGLFLMLIGLFPEGTSYHYRVSLGFFAMGALTVLIWGIALIQDTRKQRDGYVFVFMSIVGVLGSVLVPWPSTATVEAYGILILNIWVMIMTRITPNITQSD